MTYKQEIQLSPKLNKNVGLILAAVVLITTSACSATGTAPKSVNSFCLVDQTISLSIALQPNIDDIGNQWDSEETRAEVTKHNQIYRETCLQK